jgi:GMP synthase (glutamine-hydrolysing)
VQFHPEVVHTARGREYLSNFVFRVCGCRKDWDPRHRVPLIEQEIRDCVGRRKVFFFVSGGVDSSVAFTLARRALGPERVRGVYVDTGLMREGETDFVRSIAGLEVEDAQREFLAALEGSTEPERKRHIIGEEFVLVQERVIERQHLVNEDWMLGQGTIYPDTIESGGTAKAALIKTHHNRVAGIQRLIASGRIVEPLKSFYKDEVREVGRELGLPAELLDRHPFPGPGLAIRCLCSDRNAGVEATADGWLIPLRSVGVQGDERSYKPVLAIDEPRDGGRADPPCGERNARAGLFADGGAHRAAETGRRYRAAALARKWIRPAGLAVSGDSHPVRDPRGSRFRGAAAGGFGGRHDGPIDGDGSRTARADVRGAPHR